LVGSSIWGAASTGGSDGGTSTWCSSRSMPASWRTALCRSNSLMSGQHTLSISPGRRSAMSQSAPSSPP
jgi:hypothetical protein